MKFIDEQLTRMESMAKAKGLTMKKACALAGVAESTPSRWKSGKTSPKMQQFAKLFEVIENYKPEKVKKA